MAAALCWPGTMVGDNVIELGFLVSARKIGFRNDKSKGVSFKLQKHNYCNERVMEMINGIY